MHDAEETIGGQASEINKLNHIITEADIERGAMKKEYDQVRVLCVCVRYGRCMGVCCMGVCCMFVLYV